MSEYLDSSVVVLNDNEIVSKNGDVYINNPKFKGKLGLLKCYAPWCPHCTHMVDDLKYLSDRFNDSFIIGSVDCDKYGDVSKKVGLSGYPTLYFIDENGKIDKKYEGSRDKNTIVNNIKNYVNSKL